MTDAVPDPALDPALYRIEQTTCVIRSDLAAYVGVNPRVARFIANATGDAIVPPYRTVGYLDAEQRGLVLAIHSLVGKPDRAHVSFVHDGLPLCRDILLSIAVALFDEIGVAEVVTLVHPADHARRDALARLGFRITGREPNPYGERIAFTATIESLPAIYRRARLRRSQ